MIAGLLQDIGQTGSAYVVINVMAYGFGEALGGFLNKYFMAIASIGYFLIDLSAV
jgi:hypothetical protein